MVHSGRRVALHVYVATLFLTLMIASAATNITMQYLQTRQMMLSASTTVFGHIDRRRAQRSPDATMGRSSRPTCLPKPGWPRPPRFPIG